MAAEQSHGTEKYRTFRKAGLHGCDRAMPGAGVVYLGIISVFAGAISLVTPLSPLGIRTRLCEDGVLALCLLIIVTG